MIYQRIIKPILDFALAVLLIIFLFPWAVFISILILINFKQSPFFVQQRIGRREVPFSIYKFRTMTDERSEIGELLPDNQRTNWVGGFLRRMGLDELPQLINILKGEMSFVGPRPLLPEYIPLFSEKIRERHNVKPGITGLAQINGGNELEWEKRFELDLKYVKNISLFIDLKILILTFFHIAKKKSLGEIGAYKNKGGIF